MPALTPEQAIEQTLKKYPKVRTIPIHNVAHWPNNPSHNRANLKADTTAYAWKGDLLKAIRHVLKLQNKL